MSRSCNVDVGGSASGLQCTSTSPLTAGTPPLRSLPFVRPAVPRIVWEVSGENVCDPRVHPVPSSCFHSLTAGPPLPQVPSSLGNAGGKVSCLLQSDCVSVLRKPVQGRSPRKWQSPPAFVYTTTTLFYSGLPDKHGGLRCGLTYSPNFSGIVHDGDE